MGDFLGHFLIGSFLLLLAFWLMYKGFTRYIKSQLGQGKYELQYSYTTKICGRNIPIEQMVKAIFSCIIIIYEVSVRKFEFLNKDGEVIGVSSIMHISFYLIFFVHCVVDLCMKSGIKGFPDHMDFYSASMAFFWLALSLYYHVKMRSEEDLEYALHIMPTYAIYMIAVTLLLMPFMPTSYLLDLIRCCGLVIFGTWFINTGFILYKPSIYPDGGPSHWDQNRPQNAHFVEALLGYHISLSVVIVVFFYQISYRLVIREMKGNNYKHFNNHTHQKDSHESVCLMVGEN